MQEASKFVDELLLVDLPRSRERSVRVRRVNGSALESGQQLAHLVDRSAPLLVAHTKQLADDGSKRPLLSLVAQLSLATVVTLPDLDGGDPLKVGLGRSAPGWGCLQARWRRGSQTPARQPLRTILDRSGVIAPGCVQRSQQIRQPIDGDAKGCCATE